MGKGNWFTLLLLPVLEETKWICNDLNSLSFAHIQGKGSWSRCPFQRGCPDATWSINDLLRRTRLDLYLSIATLHSMRLTLDCHKANNNTNIPWSLFWWYIRSLERIFGFLFWGGLYSVFEGMSPCIKMYILDCCGLLFDDAPVRGCELASCKSSRAVRVFF